MRQEPSQCQYWPGGGDHFLAAFSNFAKFPGQNWKNHSVKPGQKEVCPSGYCSVKQQICKRLKIKSNCSSRSISLLIVIVRVENWPCKSQQQLLSEAGEVQICSHAPYLGAKQPHQTGVYFQSVTIEETKIVWLVHGVTLEMQILHPTSCQSPDRWKGRAANKAALESSSLGC